MLNSAQLHYVLRGDAAGARSQVTDGPTGLQKTQGSPHTAAPVDAPSILLVNDRTDSSDPDMDKRIGAALRPALFAQRG